MNNKLKMKNVLIIGVSGQDGSYLAEYLLRNHFIVHGVIRHSSSMKSRSRIDHLKNNKKFFLHYGDITDYGSISDIIIKTKPKIIYNLAAQSHVQISNLLPIVTSNINGIGCLNVLEIIKTFNKKIRFYQASTSELFGTNNEKEQNEKTVFQPVSPYAISKLFSYHICQYYRQAYGMYVVNGILFNHESFRRGNNFVTKKIIEGAVKIKNNINHIIELGNLDAKRDWGYAPEYVEGMHKMMIQKNPDDYVLATGQTHSIKEFVDETFKQLNIPIKWTIDKNNFKVKRLDNNKIILKSNNYYKRNIEVDWLKGDYKKAMIKLNWKPKVKFKQLIKLMLEEEILNFKN